MLKLQDARRVHAGSVDHFRSPNCSLHRLTHPCIEVLLFFFMLDLYTKPKRVLLVPNGDIVEDIDYSVKTLIRRI